jgi:hypothetical protein
LQFIDFSDRPVWIWSSPRVELGGPESFLARIAFGQVWSSFGPVWVRFHSGRTVCGPLSFDRVLSGPDGSDLVSFLDSVFLAHLCTTVAFPKTVQRIF